MRCISRIKHIGVICLVAIILLTGCGRQISYTNSYDITNARLGLPIGALKEEQVTSLFAEDLCVPTGDFSVDTEVDLDLSEAGGLFDITSANVLYNKNLYERLHPASLTKTLTALIALKYGNLNDVLKVSEKAMITEPGAQLCGLQPGDTLTLEQALYGLLVYSGNDAGMVIAEHISGSVEEFANLMNEEARMLGATGSNFMNPHGLTDENHYSTAYDLYLIFQEAIKNQTFLDIIKTESYTMHYTLSDGSERETSWNTTNRFLNGDVLSPEGTLVLGGKTGTTEKAGSCLVILSENSDSSSFVSIILKSQDKTSLYTEMVELLNEINK